MFPEENDDEDDDPNSINKENKCSFERGMNQYTLFFEECSGKAAISMIDTKKVIDFKEMMRELIRKTNINVEIILSEMTNLNMSTKQLR